MGLSASQAQLLSITSRLSDNELRAQFITNSKVRLAESSNEAAKEYMSALDNSKLMYNFYDAKGNKTYENLTAGLIMGYAANKNQYALINTSGQALVTSEDEKNFIAAADLDEFLALNGVEFVDNPEYAEKLTELYGADYTRFHNKNNISEAYDKICGLIYGDGKLLGDSGHMPLSPISELLHRDSESGLWVPSAYTSDHANVFNNCFTGRLHYDIYGDPTKTTAYHDPTAWAALVASGNQPVSGTIGNLRVTVTPTSGGGANVTVTDSSDTFNVKLKEDIYNAFYNRTDPSMGGYFGNWLQMFYTGYDGVTSITNTPANTDAARSSFATAAADMAKFVNMLETYQRTVKELLDSLPKSQIASPNDTKTEWYKNLWYRMGAISETQKPAALTSFKVLDEKNLLNSDWLKYMLETGSISIEQAIYSEKGSETYLGMTNRDWKAKSYGSTTDISSQQDEQAIAKAEVKYEKTLRDIQTKDKQFDNDLKKLDTQHNALQQEYESIKGIIDKNTERSFKAFS